MHYLHDTGGFCVRFNVAPVPLNIKIAHQNPVKLKFASAQQASHKQLISECDFRWSGKRNNDLSEEDSGPQRALSLQRARYVKCIIAPTV